MTKGTCVFIKGKVNDVSDYMKLTQNCFNVSEYKPCHQKGFGELEDFDGRIEKLTDGEVRKNFEKKVLKVK